MMSKKKKKSKAVPVVIVLTILLAALCVGCFYAGNILEREKADRLAAAQAEVEARNAQADLAYAAAIADFQAQNAGGANLAWPAQKTEGWDLLDLTNYPLENQITEHHTRADLMNNGMLLVNEWHSRPDDFSEDALVGLGSYFNWAVQVDSKSVQLFPVAADALKAALDAAAAENLGDYIVKEGYRSWDTQNSLFQARVERLSGSYSGDALIEAAKKDVNYPGTSEFNTGLSFRLQLYNKDDSSVAKQAFSSSPQGQWMYENSWKYGLIFRFPLPGWPSETTQTKHFITGVGHLTSEGWEPKLNCYRYVGVGNATIMHYMDFCLEEYVDYLMSHPHIALFEDGQLKYEVYRQVIGDDPSFDVILTGRARSHVSSLDNMGGVITVFAY